MTTWKGGGLIYAYHAVTVAYRTIDVRESLSRVNSEVNNPSERPLMQKAMQIQPFLVRIDIFEASLALTKLSHSPNMTLAATSTMT